MEAFLHQSKAMCPFLRKTSPATLRSLSTATHRSPGGGTITNLQFIARRCPVMNKALAVQSARIRTSSYSTAAASACMVKSMIMKKRLHTSAGKKANMDTRIYQDREQGRTKKILQMPNVKLADVKMNSSLSSTGSCLSRSKGCPQTRTKTFRSIYLQV